MADILFCGMNEPVANYQCPMLSVGCCLATPATKTHGRSKCVGVRRCKEIGRMIVLPEHGRLVDADALMEHLVGTHDGWIEHANTNVAIDDERIVEEEPTVIPASK